MRLLIGIATFKRIKKLERLLVSLRNQTHPDFVIHVVCDNNDYETAEWLKTRIEWWSGQLEFSVNNKHRFVIGAWNYVVQNYVNTYVNFTGFIGLCDDVELYPDALEEIVKCHQENFPDTDGVCGFHQVCKGFLNYTYKPFGQTLMGRKFIERYKEVDYKICCDKYQFLYQDEEMYQYANSLNKFKECHTAILNHYHPAFCKEEIDETHHITRKGTLSPKQHDIALFKQRQEENKLWPIN